MRNRFILVLLSLLFVALTSCDGKKQAIDDLRELRTEIRVHGEGYDAEDWEDAQKEIAEIHERLECYELTTNEEEFVEKIDSEISMYMRRYNTKGIIGEIANAVAGMIDDVAGTNAQEVLTPLFSEVDRTQRQVEKSAKSFFWTLVLWISVPIIIIAIIILFISLRNTGRTRGARRERTIRTRHR